MNNCSIAKGDDLKYAALRRQSLFIIHHSSFIPLRVRGIVGGAEVDRRTIRLSPTVAVLKIGQPLSQLR